MCIVPVSGAYKKASIRCIPQAQRWALAEAFQASVTPPPNVDVVLEDYEFTSPVAVATADSMKTLKEKFPGADNYYVAQGQDNIAAILQNAWDRSEELVEYTFLMFPRGEEQPEITTAIASGQIIPIGGDFNDETSSSEVRKRIREGGDYTSLLHPAVAAALEAMPMPYKACELAGGSFSSSRMEHKYETTVKGTMAWANSELEHVGRIASIKDKDLQYSYALSTVNGMAHLRDALYQLVKNPDYRAYSMDLLRTHDAVIRVMKHLIHEYKVNLDTIRMFNTRKVLTDFSYLKNKDTRKAKKSRRGTRRA